MTGATTKPEDVLALCTGKNRLTAELAMAICKRKGKRFSAYRCRICTDWNVGHPIPKKYFSRRKE